MERLKGQIGLLGAASTGIANIIGMGIFILSGVVLGVAGPSIILSFILAGFVAFLSMLSFAELGSMITETGAGYIYTKEAFGRFWGFLVGWFKSYDYIVGAASIAVGFASYFAQLFDVRGTTWHIGIVALVPIFCMVIQILGIKQASDSTMLLVCIKLLALMALIVVGAWYMSHHAEKSHFIPFFPTGVDGMMQGASMIFVVFLGFNTINLLSEEVKEPTKTIPRALFLAFFLAFILYVGISIIEAGVLNWHLMKNNATPLADIAHIISSNYLFNEFIAVSALVAIGSVALSSMLGGSRTLFAMGRDRLLPAKLGEVSKSGAPQAAIVINGIAVTLLSVFFYDKIETLAALLSFGSLVTFIFVHLSLMHLRGARPATFKTPLYPIVPILGIASCVALMLYLNRHAQFAGIIWGLLGLVYYQFVRPKKNDI